MGVQRKAHRGQRQARSEGAFARWRAGTPPDADRARRANDPECEADDPGFAQHFQYELVRVRRTFAGLRIDEGIAGPRERGVGIAKTAHANAGERMRDDHARGRAPDAQAAGSGFVQRVFRSLHCEQAALHAGSERTRIVQRDQRRERDQTRSAHAPHSKVQWRARLPPDEYHRDKGVHQPCCARAGEQDWHQRKHEGDDETAPAEARTRGGQQERGQHRQHWPEFQIFRAEDAG